MRLLTRKAVHGYLRSVRKPACQSSPGSCVIAQFLERRGYKDPSVSSGSANVTTRRGRKMLIMPEWARSLIRAFDNLNSATSWISANDYRRPLLKVLRKA